MPSYFIFKVLLLVLLMTAAGLLVPCDELATHRDPELRDERVQKINE